jgi:hypothetical protein
MIKNKAIICSLCLAAAVLTARGQTQETVNLDSGSQTLFNQSNVALSGGSTSIDGDGDVIQLGYFSGPNFTGTFTPITGDGSVNIATVPESSPIEPYNRTSIGDVTAEGAGDGTFFMPGLTFVTGSLLSGNNLPGVGTQLSLRIFNGTTVATSTFFNTVTDTAWVWQTPVALPNNATVNVTLDATGLVWQDAANPFHTTIPNTVAVPEPSTYASALLGLGTLGLAVIRRRFRK